MKPHVDTNCCRLGDGRIKRKKKTSWHNMVLNKHASAVSDDSGQPKAINVEPSLLNTVVIHGDVRGRWDHVCW